MLVYSLILFSSVVFAKDESPKDCKALELRTWDRGFIWESSTRHVAQNFGRSDAVHLLKIKKGWFGKGYLMLPSEAYLTDLGNGKVGFEKARSDKATISFELPPGSTDSSKTCIKFTGTNNYLSAGERGKLNVTTATSCGKKETFTFLCWGN